MNTLDWTRATSADGTHDDVEVDLDGPMRAAWADVTQDRHRSRRPWTWRVYNAWLADEAEVIAIGGADSQEAGKAAVEAWIATFTKEGKP